MPMVCGTRGRIRTLNLQPTPKRRTPWPAVNGFDPLDLSLSMAMRRQHWLPRMARMTASARRASRNPATTTGNQWPTLLRAADGCRCEIPRQGLSALEQRRPIRGRLRQVH
jgi:hypothetical protein